MACVISCMYDSTMRLVNMYDATFDIEYTMNGEILNSKLNIAYIIRITFLATNIILAFFVRLHKPVFRVIDWSLKPDNLISDGKTMKWQKIFSLPQYMLNYNLEKKV